MYKQSKLYAPYEQDQEQDMWVAEIDYEPVSPSKSDIDHSGVIEVRADNKDLLGFRVHTIIRALNDATYRFDQVRVAPTEIKR